MERVRGVGGGWGGGGRPGTVATANGTNNATIGGLSEHTTYFFLISSGDPATGECSRTSQPFSLSGTTSISRT